MGHYDFVTLLTSQNYNYATSPASTAVFENYIITISGVLQVNPKEIEVIGNAYAALGLVYSGINRITEAGSAVNTFSGNNRVLKKDTDFSVNFKQNSIEVKEIINAGTYTAILSSTNYKFIGGTDSGILGGKNYFDMDFSVEQAALKIRLFDTYSIIPSEQVLIQKYYTGSPIIVQLDNTNAVKFTNGAMGTEYVVVSYRTSAKNAGEYFYGTGVSQFGTLFIYDKGDEIVGGAANYNISVEGGIEIIMQSTLVEFTNLSSLVYKNENFEILMQLTRLEGKVIVDETEFEYDYINEQFKNKETGTSISTDILKLNINGESASSTNVLKNAGNYTLDLINTDGSYMFSSSGGQEHTKNVIIDAVSIIFDLGMRYIDYSEDFDEEISFDGVGGEIFNIAFNCGTNLFNVGHYDFETFVTSDNYDYATSPASTAIFENYIITISGVLQINPKEIGIVGNAYAALNLIYSGVNRINEVDSAVNTFSGNIHPLVKDTDFWVKFTQNSIEVKEIINVGTYTAVLSSKNYVFAGKTPAELGGLNFVELNFNISKKDLTVALFSKDNATEFIKLKYRNQILTFNITQDNFQDYITGTVNGEKITTAFATNSGLEGLYPYSESNPDKFTKQSVGFVIYSAGGTVMPDGLNNYNVLPISGGIDIVYIFTTVEFVDLQGLTYNGSNREFSINLITDLTPLGSDFEIVEESLTIVYGASGNFFKQDDVEISTNKLNVSIERDTAAVGTIKRVGQYKITIKSLNSDYVFEGAVVGTPSDSYSYNTQITKANIDFSLDTITIQYGNILTETKTFNGVGNEVFVLKLLNSNVAVMWVKSYNIADYVTLANFTYIDGNTADFENYNITITGILDIIARKIVATADFGELIYNGKTYYSTIKNTTITFKDAETPYQERELRIGKDYIQKFFNSKGQETTDFIQAGLYNVQLSSTNHEFIGNSATKNGDYNLFELEVEIQKAPMQINLFNTYDAENPENNQLIRALYNDKFAEFELTNSNNAKYISGAVNGERVLGTFRTNGVVVGEYLYSDTELSTDLMVIKSNGSAIINGLDNYDISISGGIEIILNLTQAEFIGLENLVYSGTNIPINVILSLYDITGAEVSKHFVYDYENSQFISGGVVVPTSELSLEINDIAVSDTKNAGTYDLTLISEDFTYVFSDESNKSVKVINIIPAEIILDLGYKEIFYGENFNYSADNPFDGVGDEQFYLSFTHDTSNFGVENSPYPFGFLNADSVSYIEGKSNPLNFKDNYNITFAGELIIKAQEITVEEKFSSFSSEYNGTDKITEIYAVDNIFRNKSGDLINLELGIDYSLTIYNSGTQVNQIINAGTYQATLSSTNYNFEGAILIGGIYNISFEFNIASRNIAVDFVIEPNLVYNGTNQNPVSWSWLYAGSSDETDAIINSDNLGETLLYSNGFDYVRNAGGYTVTLSIMNSNYLIVGGAQSVPFIISPFVIFPAEPSAIYFEKFFNAFEPELIFDHYQELNESGEIVKIKFEREAGETVGQYALTSPTLDTAKNSALIQNNFTVDASEFIDNFKAFLIKPLEGEEGNLTIIQKQNIEIIYNAQTHTSISYEDYSDCFIILNYMGDELEVGEFDLTADFTFGTGIVVRNAGEYNLILGSANSLTHQGEQLNFDNNGFSFVILKREIDVENSSGDKINKQYDKTSEATVDSILNLSNVCVEDIDAVTLTAIYVDADLQEIINVGNDYFLLLKLTGSEAENYYIIYEKIFHFTGDITPRKLTVTGNSNAFDKEYDKTSNVNTAFLTLENTIAGDEVEYNGKYISGAVEVNTVGTYEITFTTTNSNYVIILIGGQVYTGEITQRILTVSDTSTLFKSYDETPELDVSKIDITARIIDGDIVNLNSAVLADSIEGVHDITFTLDGADSANYTVESRLGEIVPMVVEIRFHYGDESGVYELPFANDGEKIIKTIINLDVIYGTRMNDVRNGIASLPLTERKGYEFSGWFTSMDTTPDSAFYISTIIDEPNFILDDIILNGGFIDVYAKWNIKQFVLQIELHTERADNSGYYIQSNEGGSYSINGKTYNNTFETIIFDYYTLIDFDFSPKTNFNFDGLYQIMDKLTEEMNYSYTVKTDNEILIIKFERKVYRVFITTDTPAGKLSGFTNGWNYDENFGIAVRFVKSGEIISLPQLNRIGYNLVGFAENESGVPTYNAGDTFNIIDTDLEFFAKWQAKEYNVYLDYAGGTLAQSYSRAIFDDVLGGYYITITFDSIFGELPLLEKPGFLQKLWMLEKGETILSVDNSKNTLWVFALDSDEPYILVATWETDENTIELTSDLNSELYTEKGISIYNSYDNVLSVLCFLNGQSVGEYSSALTATTGSKVQLSAINNSEYYVFDGWYIVEGGIETQIIDTMIINGATFEAIDENLIIFDFTWGVNCPEIIAKYKPFAVEVVLGDYAETYANIDFASGIYEENEKSWTLTGAVVSVEYTVSPGYELIGIEIINASYEQFGGETGSGSINIYDFNKRVEINFKFDRQAYELTINTTGEINGIGSLKYLVIESDESGSTNEFMLYSIPILIKTDQFVIIQLGIKYGYENLVDWTWTGGGDNVEISKTNEFYESNLLIVEKEIFGFISELTLSIELQKQVFEVNATCEIYTDDGYIIDTTENQYKITDSNGTDINSAEYLDEVTFSAMCFIANFNHNDTQLEIQKYEFIGWFVKINDMYINKSDALNYTIELEADTALIARFKLKNYNINLEVKNNEGGYLITETGQTHQTLLIVEFGKSLTNSVHINRNGGYVFVRWEVTYSYMAFDNGLETTVDFTEYLTTETIEPNDIGIICGNILISAEFDTKEITVEAQALFIDETTDVDTKISLSYLGETGIYLIFESRTHEEIIITAHTLLEGYAFLYWDIPGTYDILSESISELCEGGYYLISSTIKIKYTDDSDNQTITAYFERFEHQVITTLKLDNGQTLGGGFVSDSDDHGAEPVLTSFVKTEEFFEIYVTLYDGYFIDLDSPLENWCYVSGLSKENISIVLEEITSMNFKLTISGVLYRTDIIIHVERNKTEFRFFDKGENDWIFSGNTAIVEYGTNKILIVGDDSFLIPTQTTHDFLGWSRDKIILNIIITADGNLNFDKWFENDASIDLYARWDFRKIKLDVTVDPISATFTQDYYPELFRNLGSSQPIQIDNNFYFYVGATFGISLPNVKTQYGFIEYSVLKPNGNGGFVWHSIEYKPGSTELSKSLFSIESYSDYIYSTSNGSGFDVSNLTDGTIYIKLIYGVNIHIMNKNYYNSNNSQEIGGDSRINTNLVFGTFRIGTEIQLSAFTSVGYEFKYWLVNEIEYVEKQQTVTVCENMSIEAFFVGKRVKLNVMATPEGQGGPISGGNIEEIDGIIYYHVGDVLLLNAMPSIGYKFENKWIHKTAGEFQSTYYAINERDGVAELLELTPMFAQKDLDVRFQIEGSRGNVELESEKDVRFKVTIVESKAIFSYTTNYFSEISVQINANDKFKYVSILMYINGTSTDVSHLVDASGLFTISQTVGFNNTDEVLFVLNYKKIYWYEYIVEEERLHIDGEEHEILYDLVGKGEAGDPYKISTIEDYALWAYIINHNLVQTNSNKTPYNTPFTYYEIDSQVFFNARYWTPIGTSQNPFNGSVHILYGARRIGIDVDVEDEKYPVELFDAEVLQQWGGLFGYLSDTAEIIEVEPNFAIILLIGGGIALVIAIVIIATSSITNRRQRLFSSLNKPRLLK
ncbi:MAG: hypothetical protein PHC47_02280 [Clostridia bacterium]|nr:hypothetical protein [Clostridia bacterium]